MGSWAAIAEMHEPRSFFTASLLRDGTVLVAGGFTTFGDILNSAEVYDSASGTWRFTASMNGAREGHTATGLNDGTVLVAGGGGTTISAEIYQPGA